MNNGEYSLNSIDQMSLSECQALSFNVRNHLLDLVLKDSRKFFGKQPERQVGLMSDYFEEDMLRFLKLKAIRIYCGGFIPVDAEGKVPTLDPRSQFKLVFENIHQAMKAANMTCDRIVNCVIFMKNMDYWDEMNEFYRQYITCSPTRAAIGCHDLNYKYQLEVINVIAYKVSS